ncbi:hypothetical protein OAD96_02130, partial [Pseudomonadales bacterium]|nr:hypothetical protein [Pseudomonadales bacterium]
MTDIDHLKDYHVRGRKFDCTSAITTLDRSSENVVYFPYLLPKLLQTLLGRYFCQLCNGADKTIGHTVVIASG